MLQRHLRFALAPLALLILREYCNFPHLNCLLSPSSHITSRLLPRASSPATVGELRLTRALVAEATCSAQMRWWPRGSGAGRLMQLLQVGAEAEEQRRQAAAPTALEPGGDGGRQPPKLLPLPPPSRGGISLPAKRGRARGR
jgi:hypothetical protein